MALPLSRFLDDGRIDLDTNAVEPYAYLHDVLTRMVDRHPASKRDELLPFKPVIASS